MDESLQSAIRKEMDIYLKEKELEDQRRQLEEENKELKMLSIVMPVGTLFVTLMLTIIFDVDLLYYAYASVFYVGAMLLSFFILKWDKNPPVKRLLLMFPMIIYMSGLNVPLVHLGYL